MPTIKDTGAKGGREILQEKYICGKKHQITINGVTKGMGEWARIYGIPYQTISARINKCGWPIEKAIITPSYHAKDKTFVGGIPKWKHSDLHEQLSKKHGKASKCEHCGSPDKSRYEWALKKGHQYSSNADDYLQLCTSCHQKYDSSPERRAKQVAGHQRRKELLGLSTNKIENNGK